MLQVLHHAGIDIDGSLIDLPILPHLGDALGQPGRPGGAKRQVRIGVRRLVLHHARVVAAINDRLPLIAERATEANARTS